MMTDFKDEDVKIRPAVKEDCYVIRYLNIYSHFKMVGKVRVKNTKHFFYFDNFFFFSFSNSFSNTAHVHCTVYTRLTQITL